VLDELTRRGVESLSPEERGNVQYYLKFAVLEGAQRFGAYKTRAEDGGNGRSRFFNVIDEEQYAEEIAWLHRLAGRNRYSSQLEGWLAHKRHAFIDEFRRDPCLIRGTEHWAEMNLGQRREFLEAVMRRRLETFSDRQFSFVIPRIDFLIEPANGLDAGAHGSLNKVEFNMKVLEMDDPTVPLMSIYHEGTHNILTQLAMAAKEGNIARTHPLFEDIQKALFSRENALGAPPQIDSLYRADDEERLAYQEQEYFLSNLQRGYGLRAKFDLACFFIQQRWKGDSSDMGLRAMLHDFRFG